MRRFTQKLKPTQQAGESSADSQSRSFPGQSGEIRSILQLQRSIGNQAVLRLRQTHDQKNEKPTLRKGDSGAEVTTLQNMLNSQDIGAPLIPDGQFGPLTQKAVMTFQSLRGQPIDGVVGPMTWTALNSGAQVADNQVPPEGEEHATSYLPLDEVLEVGSKGKTVKLAQGLLNSLGAQLEIDGAFGWITHGSVSKFQRVNGLSETGSIEREDWLRLGSGKAKRLDGDEVKDDGQPGIQKGFGTTKTTDNGGPNDYQWTSWVNPESPPGGMIGQIYFPTGGTELDDEDAAELQKIRCYHRAFTHPDRNVPYLFMFVGYADHRQIEGGNESLTLRRAAMVENDVLINQLGARPDKYRTAHQAIGADPHSAHGDPADRLAQARRVDIYAEAPVYPPKETTPPEPGHDWCEKLSDHWEIRIDGSLSAAAGLGGEVYGIFIKDLTNGYFQGMRYVGIGAFPGVPISYAGPSPWQEFTTSRAINIRHFQGFAQHMGAISALPGTHLIARDKFILNGPSYKNANHVILNFVTPLTVGSDAGNNFGGGFAFTTGGLHIVDGPEKP